MEENFFLEIIDIVEDLVKVVELDRIHKTNLIKRIEDFKKSHKEYYERHNAIMKGFLEKAKKMEKELEESNERLDVKIAKWKKDSKEREADRKESMEKLRRMSDELGPK